MGSPTSPHATPAPESLVDRMRGDLVVARRGHDDAAVSALRTVLSAMANAEAPPRPAPESAPRARPASPETEVDRLVLSPSDLDAILADEIADRHDTIAIYERHGRNAEAEDLRAQLAVLRRYLR